MNRGLIRTIGIIVLLLGVIGLVTPNTQIFSMNTDMLLTGTRIALGVILVASSFMGEGAERTAVALFGIVYIANFLTALVSPTMFGFLPHMYGILDNSLHLVGGLLGLFLAFRPAHGTQTRHAM